MINETHEITAKDKATGKLGTITVTADGDWLYRRLLVDIGRFLRVDVLHQRRADPPINHQPPSEGN